MIQWTLVPFTRKARKARGKETTRAKESPKARAKERASKMRKERVLGKASRIKKNSKVLAGIVARQDTSRANVGRKAAAKQANNVSETEKTGDVNWIMMVQDLSVGHSSTSEFEKWRCSGASVSCKKKTHTSHTF